MPSSLLTNIVRDIIDNELEKVRCKFVPYIDSIIVITMTKKEEFPTPLSFVIEVIEGKLQLKSSKDKSELTNFKRCFMF